MPCRKGTKQTPQVIIDEIMREHENGVTIKELTIKYDKPLKTIRNMITRENHKKKNSDKGIIPKSVGRPRKTSLSLENENARLRMENDLLKSFLKEIERAETLHKIQSNLSQQKQISSKINV